MTTGKTIHDRRGKEVSLLTLPDQDLTTLHIRDRHGKAVIAFLGQEQLVELGGMIQEAIAAHQKGEAP